MDSCIDHILSINKTNIEIQKGNFSTWDYNKKLRDSFELSQNEKLKKEIRRLNDAAHERAGWSDKTEASKIGTHQADRGYIGHTAAKLMKRSKAIERRIKAETDAKEKLLKNIEESSPLKITPLSFHSKKFIECRSLSLYYDGRSVTDNLSFTVEQGDRISLSGKNGSGKSSVIKLITGDGNINFTGELKITSGLTISYLKQDASHLSGSLSDYERENGIDSSLFRAILRKLDFSREQFEKSLDSYSDGQKKKILIARSLSEKAHLYVWDEPLNFIDVISRIQIENLLFEYKPTLLFVEHDELFCKNIATKTIYL